jgi:hypothetical protein
MGGAVKAEFQPPGLPAIGLKNASIDNFRIERGLQPLLKPARDSNPAVFKRAMDRIDMDPEWQNRLIQELTDQIRVVTPEEHIALLHRYADLRNDYYKVYEGIKQAQKDGQLDVKQALELDLNRIGGLLANLEQIAGEGGGVGTAAGRALAIRRAMMHDDFSQASLEVQMRKAKGLHRDLNEADRAEIERVSKAYQETLKELERVKAELEKAKKDDLLEQLIKELKAESGKPSRNRTELRKSFDVSLREQVTKLKKAVENGNESMIGSLAKKLARLFYEIKGIRTRDPLIDAVHSVIQKIDPSFTRTDTAIAMSNYGKYRQLTENEITRGLTEIRGQILQVMKLKDMAEGKPPRRTGFKRQAPEHEQRRLIKLVNEAKREFQVPVTDPSTQLKSSLDTLKTRMENRISDYENMLKNRDFELRKRRPPIKRDAEADRLQMKLNDIQMKWRNARFEDQMKNWSLAQKAKDAFFNIVGLHRALLSSFEMSAVLRQGKLYMWAHPFKHVSKIKESFRALRSEKARQQIDMEIRERPNYWLYERDKLYLAEHGVPLHRMEEAYRSRWAEKVPGIAMSERAYTTFLNVIRADYYDLLAKNLSRNKAPTPEEGAVIANMVNVWTGRGKVPMMETAAGDLANLFFAPRYVASRLNALTGQPLWTKGLSREGSAKARKLVAEEYGRTFAGMAAYYALIGSFIWLMDPDDVSITFDPRSSDFGKIRIGNTRVDPMAGLAQMTTYAGRMASGETKTPTGEVRALRDQWTLSGKKMRYGQSGTGDVTGRFLRQKLHPTVQVIADIMTGMHVDYDPVTAESLFWHQAPMTYQDLLKLMEDQGVPRGTALMMLAFFGEGIMTYDPPKKRRR